MEERENHVEFQVCSLVSGIHTFMHGRDTHIRTPRSLTHTKSFPPSLTLNCLPLNPLFFFVIPHCEPRSLPLSLPLSLSLSLPLSLSFLSPHVPSLFQSLSVYRLNVYCYIFHMFKGLASISHTHLKSCFSLVDAALYIPCVCVCVCICLCVCD